MIGFEEKFECGKVVFEVFFFEIVGDFKVGFDKEDINIIDIFRIWMRIGIMSERWYLFY